MLDAVLDTKNAAITSFPNKMVEQHQRETKRQQLYSCFCLVFFFLRKTYKSGQCGTLEALKGMVSSVLGVISKVK